MKRFEPAKAALWKALRERNGSTRDDPAPSEYGRPNPKSRRNRSALTRAAINAGKSESEAKNIAKEVTAALKKKLAVAAGA